MSVDPAPAEERVVVASLGAERLPPAGPDSTAHTPLVPAGVCHAAPLGGRFTLCGLLTESLAWFPGLSFSGADCLSRCEACLTKLTAV
jgi:hypothetical protein